jgi:hypothetical protein
LVGDPSPRISGVPQLQICAGMKAMKVKHSHGRPRKTPDAAVDEILRGVSPKALREHVNMLAFPRHYVAEKRANRRTIREHNIGSVMIVFFNREEDGLLASSEFVTRGPKRPEHQRGAYL